MLQGVHYDVAAMVINSEITIPFSETITIGEQDRDVILAQSDVDTAVVNPELYCSSDRISADGCNYFLNATAAIPADDPFMTVEFTRGFVAVDAQIEDRAVRIVNTHLEVRCPDPTNEDSALVQSMQAQELIGFLTLFPKPEAVPTILLGDINSSPEDMPIPSSTYGDISPPYMQLVHADYIDTWTLRPGKPKGYTCCYNEDLSEWGHLSERIDMIFTDVMPDRVKANVVGNNKSDRTDSGLWPSDHAGVVGRIEFPWLF